LSAVVCVLKKPMLRRTFQKKRKRKVRSNDPARIAIDGSR
jgi:hypothetical protein